MKTSIFYLLLITAALSACNPSEKKDKTHSFIRGVYGNPASLLEAGYSFDSLGLNAVFVRSISLTPAFFDTARRQGCDVFVEFPTLSGKEYLQHHPEAWPIDEQGQPAAAADWFMGICPTDTAFKTYRVEQLKKILDEYDVAGIFLDYVHWHAQFETTEPILPETCFCDRCTTLFAEQAHIDIPGDRISDKASWILTHQDKKWRTWRNSILNGWVTDMKEIVKEARPDALLGVYYCAWYPSDYDSALYRNLGIDVNSLATNADVLAPMLFHKMNGRPVEWVGEYIRWLHSTISSPNSNVPLIWPIVQAHNSPVIISPEEFRKVMDEGSRSPSSGIMMFSDQSLIQDPEKIQVMRSLYTGED